MRIEPDQQGGHAWVSSGEAAQNQLSSAGRWRAVESREAGMRPASAAASWFGPAYLPLHFGCSRRFSTPGCEAIGVLGRLASSTRGCGMIGIFGRSIPAS